MTACIFDSIENKWLENSDKRPHRHLVTPRVGEWIRPTLTAIKFMVPWAHISQSSKRHGISIGSAVLPG